MVLNSFILETLVLTLLENHASLAGKQLLIAKILSPAICKKLELQTCVVEMVF